MSKQTVNNKFTTIEEDNMRFQSLFNLSIQSAMALAKSINKVIRGSMDKDTLLEYLNLLNSEFIYTCKMCERAYTELEAILKRFRVSPHGKTKSATIIYAHFRITESFALFQRVKDEYIVNRNYKTLITALKTIRQQLRSIYICKQ